MCRAASGGVRVADRKLEKKDGTVKPPPQMLGIYGSWDSWCVEFMAAKSLEGVREAMVAQIDARI